MFRISVLTFTILLASCGDTLAQAPARSGVAVPIAAATPASVISEGSREIDRWIAICRRDPMDFLDNREYCLRIGPWESAITPR